MAVTQRNDNLDPSDSVPSPSIGDLQTPKMALVPQTLPRQETVALGDNHGCNPELLRQDLVRAGILGSDGLLQPNFKGVLIQVGDTVDRGSFSQEIFSFWRDLQRSAPNQVVRLLGNHELYHLVGASFVLGAPPLAGLQRALVDDILSGKIVAAFAEGDTLYTHAGLDLKLFPEYSSRPLDQIVASLNERLIKMTAEIDPPDTFKNIRLMAEDPMFSAGPHGNGFGGGIFWARQNVANSEFRQVVGHTPQTNGIRATDRVKFIDVQRYKLEITRPEAGRALLNNTVRIELLAAQDPKSDESA